MITFDDGNADIAKYALPLQQRLGFSAGVYLTTARIGANSAWDEAKGLTPMRLMDAVQIQRG
jgi:peptidoglycan/xylan/chitin deacetylase (PgdA/CDA1 family)